MDQRPSGRPNRQIRLPKRYRDELPVLPISVPPPVDQDEPPDVPQDVEMDSEPPERSSSHTAEWLCTDTDAYDLFREYHHTFPTYDPENSTYFGVHCDSSTFQHLDGDGDYERPWYAGFGQSLGAIHRDYFAPFLNATTFRLMSWFYNSSSSKSLQDLDRLVNDVILSEDFRQEDLKDFNASREAKRPEKTQGDPSSIFSSDEWHEASVKIRLPCEKEKFLSEAHAPEFEVNGLYYRKPLDVLRSAYGEVAAKSFHAKPYKLFWQPDDNELPKCRARTQ